MGYRDHNPGKRIQVVFQNSQCRNIQIISCLIKQKYVCIFSQDTQKIQPSFFSSRKLSDRCVLHIRREKKTFQKLCCTDPAILRRDILCNIFYIIDHSLAVIHMLLFLCKISDLYGFSNLDGSTVRLYDPCDHF